MSPLEGFRSRASRNRHAAGGEVEFVGGCAKIDFLAVLIAVGGKRLGWHRHTKRVRFYARSGRRRVGGGVPIMLGNKSGVVKLQAPEVLAVVVPSLVPVVLHTVTVEPPTAVPFNVTESLELTAMLVRLGAAGRASAGAASSALLTTVSLRPTPSHRARSTLRSFPPPSCRWPYTHRRSARGQAS